MVHKVHPEAPIHPDPSARRPRASASAQLPVNSWRRAAAGEQLAV